MTTAQIGPADFVVTASGEVDTHSAPALRAVLEGLLEPEHIVLDLREVHFLDSAGLQAITAAARRLRRAGGELFLVSDSHEVLSIFRLTGLDRFLTVRPTLAAAVDELGARTA